MKKSVILVLLLIISYSSLSQKRENKIKEVIALRDKSKNQNSSLKERLQLATRSVEIAKTIKSDSSVLLSNRQLSLLYYQNDQFDDYLNLTRYNIVLAKKLKDTTAIPIIVA